MRMLLLLPSLLPSPSSQGEELLDSEHKGFERQLDDLHGGLAGVEEKGVFQSQSFVGVAAGD
jgi:hypothetical protein